MTSADIRTNIPSRRSGIPIWVTIILMSSLLAVAIVGLYCVDFIFDDPLFKKGAYAVCLFMGAIALGLLLLRADEFRQIRRWNTWRCANCSKHYQLRSFGEVKFWGTQEGKRAGVLLTCWRCNKETAFDFSGRARPQK